MKYLRRLCAGVGLMLVFALPTFAGQIPCGVTEEPSQVACSEASKATVGTRVVTVDVIAKVLGGVLPIF